MSSLSSPYVKALQSFYDGIGKSYNDSTRSMHGDSAQSLVNAAGPAIKAGSWVLDLATGTGNVAFAAAAEVGSTGRVLGIDISDEFLRLASQSAHDLWLKDFVEFIKGDVGHLVLPDAYADRQSFDAVTCGSAIALFSSPAAVLDTLATKILKPGGVFVADIFGMHVPAKLFLDAAVPRGFQAPINPVWLDDPEAVFHRTFEGSMFELKAVIVNNTLSEAKWDASTAEATENLWQSIVAESTWVSFGVEKIDSKSISGIKEAWIKKLDDYKGPDGFIIAKMKRYIAVAILKGEYVA